MKALISVSDKTGIVDFAKGLADLGVEIISTGGTYQKIREAGIKVTELLTLVNRTNSLDTIIKTLYPEIFAAISVNRTDSSQMKQINDANIDVIDLVVANLYPFFDIVRKENVTHEECIEAIDIGGPTMLRSAAKNYNYITVVADPSDYSKVLRELRKENSVSLETRLYLLQKVFEITANYEVTILNYIKNIRVN